MKIRQYIPRHLPFLILVLCALTWASPSQPSTRAATAGDPFAGIWEGTLSPPQGESLRVLFRIASKPDGTYAATLDSPDQGVTGVRVSGVTVDKKAIHLQIGVIGAEFVGNLKADGSLEGKWTQKGTSLPLIFKRVEKAVEVSRPQMPKPPFPYRMEEVTFSSKPGVTLSATLTLPMGQGPFPAVLLVSGSGTMDRNESVYGHKPFLVLADYLTRRGIAVLRADKRGVGKSTGDFAKSTEEDFVEDARAGVAFLKTRREVNPKLIGVLGHSEGGLVAVRVAADSSAVDFVILLATPELPGEQIVLAQQTALLKSRGVAEDVIKARRAQQEKMLAVVMQEKDPSVAEKRLKEIVKELNPPGTSEVMIDDQVKRLLSPWYRNFLVYDPRPTLKKVKCPVLAIAGERDVQVPPRENLAAMQSALKEGGNISFTQSILPGLNHMLQPSQTGSPTEYAKIEITMAPTALKVVGDWIELQVKGR